MFCPAWPPAGVKVKAASASGTVVTSSVPMRPAKAATRFSVQPLAPGFTVSLHSL